ncbi:MAG: trigger factor [Candidatus Nanopelagicales bacterium]
MKSTVETLSPTRVKLAIEVPFDELKSAFDEAYATIGKQVTVPGFRKGKVPARVIEQRFGREAVIDEAVNNAVPKAYEDALRDNNIVPVARPEIDVTEVKDGELLSFTAEVDVRPEFELPAFDSIKVEVANAVPSDADLDEQLTSLRTRFASLKDVEREAVDGDVLLVDIAGQTPEGDSVDDLVGNALSYELGTDGMLPGFDDAVRGAKKDGEVSFTFAPQNGDWTGIDLVVHVKVQAVRERELPELNDDFAQLASEFDTVEELRADLSERLVRMKKIEQVGQAREKTHEALMELIDIPLPEGVIDAEIEDHFHDGHEGDEHHRTEVAEQARTSLKSQFILDKIAETEEISVGETELSSWLMQNAPRYGMAPDQFAQALVEAGQVPMALQDIRRGKALGVVLKQVSVVDADGNAVDLEALEAELNPMPDFGEVEVD